MKIRLCIVSTLLLTSLALTGGAIAGAEDDWRSWAGPNLDLTASARKVFPESEFGLEKSWSRSIGQGYTGVLVVGDRVVTAFSDGTSDVLVAFDAAKGDELWRYRIGDTYRGHDGSEDGPLATPSFHDNVIYGLGGAGELFAVRLADGKRVWARDIVDELGAKPALYGFATAPTIVDGVLVVQTGGPDGQSITGLDPADGSTLWATGDDPVTYQTPLALRVGGREQVFAVTDTHVMGLAPRTGELLWSLELDTEASGNFTSTQPIPLGNGKVLVTGTRASLMVQVVGESGRFVARELWRSRGLYPSHASPVPYEGHLYGYSGHSFLTCVDAATGQTKWKSREPGQGFLMLVDGHVVVLTGMGEVVVVEATPAAYREKARAGVFGRGGWTRPSFGAGRIYARSRSEIAGIEVSSSTAPTAEPASAEPAPAPRGIIATLAQQVAKADDKGAVIDAFMAAHPSTPILEGENLVHFVFRGDVDDLMLLGNMEAWESQKPMVRLEGTEFYYRSLELQPGGEYGYAFAVFDDIRLDPLNPRDNDSDEDPRSLFATKGFAEAEFLKQPDGPRGRLESHAWNSAIVGDEREVQVYLPAGYDDGDARYPLLMIYGAQGAIEQGLWDRALDNLIGRSVAPIIVAFVPSGHWSESGSGSEGFIRALESELLTKLDATYRTIAEPERRAMMGNSFAGWFATELVLRRPDLFRAVATQSPVYGTGRRDPVLALLDAAGGVEMKFAIQWTAHEYQDQEGHTAGQSLQTRLSEKGYDPAVKQIPGGSGWRTWRQHTDRLLEALFPIGDGSR